MSASSAEDLSSAAGRESCSEDSEHAISALRGGVPSESGGNHPR